MRIIEFHAENFRRLKAVTIRPDGTLVQITGANGHGKTSTLDAIWAALKGRSVAGPEPIRTGEDHARIRLDLGEMIVTRTFGRGKEGQITTGLKIVLANGTEVRRTPQAVLDAIVGELSFDPLEFARAEPKKQFDILKAFVPDFDFDENSSERKAAYEERTDLNRQLKNATAARDAIKLPPGPKPKSINIDKALMEYQEALNHNQKVATDRVAMERRIRDIDAKYEEVDRLRARARALEQEAEEQEQQLKADAINTKDSINVVPLKQKLETFESNRIAIAAFEERERLDAVVKRLETQSQTTTNTITILDREKNEAIAAAQMPVDGLTLGDDEVMLDGIPFSQASHAQKLVTSTLIAMAANPKLRVIRAYEGSTLDSKSLSALAALAETNKYQIWLERVDETGEVGIFVEDGQIKSIEGNPQ